MAQTSHCHSPMCRLHQPQGSKGGKMNRFSTMTIEIEFDFDISSVSDVWLTFVQGTKKITKKKSQRQIAIKGNTATVTLTAGETGSFEAYSPVGVQRRWLDKSGASDSSSIEYISFGDVLEEGVM